MSEVSKDKKGIVVKGIGGFYFVDTGEEIFRAKGRGLLKRGKSLIIVGDQVSAIPPAPGEDDGVITEILPRKNYFSRPPVSNLDKLIVTFSLSDPKPNLEVIDRLLVMAESKGIEAVICVNKTDMDKDESLESILSIYSPLYTTLVTCCKEGMESGINELLKVVDGSCVALAGPSGVGKSSLTNLLVPHAEMETGEISRKTQRGRHTTRHVEIFPLGDGYLYDTPGFTSFDLEGVEEDELQNYFPEIRKASENCRFNNCFHIKEPDCGVREALENGEISETRYKSYLSSLNEIRERNKY